MAEKAYKWRKVGRDLLTDERTLRLSQLALHLRLVLEVMSMPDADQRVGGDPAPGVGWLVDEYGDPYDLERLAALVHASEADTLKALGKLEAARIAVRSDAGVWGTVDHEERQLDPTTKRTRGWRERRAAERGMPSERDGNATGTDNEHYANGGERTEDRGQRTDEQTSDQREHTPRAAAPLVPVSPPRLGNTRSGPVPSEEIPAALTLEPAPAARAPAARRKAVDPQNDVAAVYANFVTYRAALGLPAVSAELLETAAKTIKAGLKAAGGFGNMLRVIRRAAEDQRRQAERAGVADVVGPAVHVGRLAESKYFRLSTLCGAATVLRYLEQPELDERRPQALARASPQRSRGPGPPQNGGALPFEIPTSTAGDP